MKDFRPKKKKSQIGTSNMGSFFPFKTHDKSVIIVVQSRGFAHGKSEEETRHKAPNFLKFIMKLYSRFGHVQRGPRKTS